MGLHGRRWGAVGPVWGLRVTPGSLAVGTDPWELKVTPGFLSEGAGPRSAWGGWPRTGSQVLGGTWWPLPL